MLMHDRVSSVARCSSTHLCLFSGHTCRCHTSGAAWTPSRHAATSLLGSAHAAAVMSVMRWAFARAVHTSMHAPSGDQLEHMFLEQIMAAWQVYTKEEVCAAGGTGGTATF